MKKLLITAVLASAFVNSAYAADEYTIDPFHTFPVFEVNHLGYSVQHGRFNKTSGKISLDMAAQKGSVELTIETASLDMGFPLWDEHMASEGFFNSAKFPSMTFKSSKLLFQDGKVVAAEGEFTLLGVTKPLTVTVKNFGCGDHPFTKKAMCGANIGGLIKRSDFGMSKSVPFVSDEVKIHVPVEAYKN